MKKSAALMIFCLILAASYAQQPEPGFAPLTPEFVRYVETLHKGTAKTTTAHGYPLGDIPHPTGFITAVPTRFQKTLDLPTKYDLRDEGTLTPVKDQQTCSCCWTFATMGSIESRWKTLGLGEYDLSENNLKNGHGFVWAPCAGGNATMATAYLSRGDGPVSEADDPYHPYADGHTPGLAPQGYLTDARFLPTDTDVLKQCLYDNGALYTNMYWHEDFFNSADDNYYYNGTENTNHCILLVGWDDDKMVDGRTGAWIIKNSWGTPFGENGFFYIAYDDSKVNSFPAFWPNRMAYNPNAIIHAYDKLGHTASFGWTDETDYGLVKFTAAEDQQITKVGTWVHAANATVRFDIYGNFNGTALSNLLGSVADQTCDYAGYYTFDLSTPITLDTGDDVYVKVKYNTPGTTYSIPTERAVTGYADPVLETGKSWVSNSGSNGSWLAAGSGTPSRAFDLCIKAYGVSTSAAVDNDPDAVLPETLMLHQNYPNPFNPVTTIRYAVPTTQHVTLKVYDLHGGQVAKLVDGEKTPGYYQIDFDAENLPSGVYFYRLMAGSRTQVRKLTVLK